MMGDDNYAAMLLNLGRQQASGYGFYNALNSADGTISAPPGTALWTRPTAKQQLDAILAPPTKLELAIAFLRSRKLYALDIKQPRIPPKERPQTVLDKWMKERHK